jgi:hypothetical protein
MIINPKTSHSAQVAERFQVDLDKITVKPEIAAHLTGISENNLTAYMDRGHVRFSTVTIGERDYRRFKRGDMVWLEIFADLLRQKLDPRAAGMYVNAFADYYPQIHQESPLKYICFNLTGNHGMPFHHVQKHELEEAFKKRNLDEVLRLPAFVVDYEATLANVDRELLYMPDLEFRLSRLKAGEV